MEFNFFSKNGKVLPIAEANVSLLSVEYTYGFGVYETLRVKNKKPLFLDDHVERLIKSAEIIRLAHILNVSDIKKHIEDMVAETPEETYNLKLLLIGARQPEDADFYIFPSAPLFPDKKLYRDGVRTITVNFERAYPQAKTLNMLQSYLAYRDAKNNGCYDALLVNTKGHITEGTRTNFLLVKGNTIYSPFEKDILLGVARKYVLETAKENGFILEERNITPDSLHEYDGAFLTSTSSKIMPIKRVDDFEFEKIPESIYRLMDLFSKR
ncbi:MAG: aminotransferase class IV [bacterium]|nr:aminotransferase class IV [bacterium]